MAKKPQAAETPAVSQDVVSIDIPATFAVHYGKWSLGVNELRVMTPTAVAYLLANGFTQSLSDAGACSKDDKAKLVDEAQKADPDNPVNADEIVANAIHAWRDERFGDILAGKVGTRLGGGPRGSAVETIMRQIATAEVKQALTVVRSDGRNTQAVNAYKAMDKDGRAKTLKAQVEKYLASSGEKLRAKAEAEMARRAEAAEGVEIDL